MKVVAHHLQTHASKLPDTVERDLFARTAFNRYYYATYLDVKKVLGALNPSWGRINHSEVPEIVSGPLHKVLSKGREQAKRESDPSTADLCSRAMNATHLLAALMTSGYATRVAADYDPEILIDFTDVFDFALNAVRVKEASDWPGKARAYLYTISSAWKQVHD